MPRTIFYVVNHFRGFNMFNDTLQGLSYHPVVKYTGTLIASSA